MVYERTADGAWARDFGLRDQIRRACVSVLSNIAEGFGRQGDDEFHRFLSMARGSAAEVKAQLYVALDLGYLTDAQFSELYGQVDEVSRLVTGFMRALKR